MVLHGIYDNGKIIIKEKDLPKIKTKIDIIFNDIVDNNKENLKKLKGIWEDRDDIQDGLKWVQNQRKLIDKRIK